MLLYGICYKYSLIICVGVISSDTEPPTTSENEIVETGVIVQGSTLVHSGLKPADLLTHVTCQLSPRALVPLAV